MTAPDDRSLEELLGAYALSGCDPAEAAAVEALLARRPDLADEADRLAAAAAWLGALEAREPPPTLRDTILATAERSDDAAARLYDAEARRLAAELARLDPAQHDVVTANGLTARSLAVHVAAQETLLARAVGRPVDTLDVTDIDDRTAVLVDRYRDRPYADVLALWREAVAAVATWAHQRPSPMITVEWLGLPMAPADALTARSFENWVHRDDLRRVRGAPADPPPAAELGLMAALSMRTLPAAMAATGRARPGRSARLVLTGDGGGSWLVALDPAEAAADEPDVTLTAGALDWCLLAAERLAPTDLDRTVDGDPGLADALVAAAPAFATL